MNGISGYSGGGRQMVEDYEAKGDDAPEYLPYGLTFQHKHVPEFKRYAGLSRGPVDAACGRRFRAGHGARRCRCSSRALNHVPTGAELHAALADHYAGLDGGRSSRSAPYAAVERTPELNPESYNDTNRMRLHVFANDSKAQAVLVAVYDNLGKGASGAAVQNMDLMLGLKH